MYFTIEKIGKRKKEEIQFGTACTVNSKMCMSLDSVIPYPGTYSKEITKDVYKELALGMFI